MAVVISSEVVVFVLPSACFAFLGSWTWAAEALFFKGSLGPFPPEQGMVRPCASDGQVTDSCQAALVLLSQGARLYSCAAFFFSYFSVACACSTEHVSCPSSLNTTTLPPPPPTAPPRPPWEAQAELREEPPVAIGPGRLCLSHLRALSPKAGLGHAIQMPGVPGRRMQTRGGMASGFGPVPHLTGFL